ncbi:DUF3667 domain-containing protein [Nonlabens sp. SCSIO 43208]|uniref:DUF3667 domain-containing protein n=1 Tax=Nonlabens sp. SCSIO 43208 TaxID=2793009 RepID=UPI003D6A3C16
MKPTNRSLIKYRGQECLNCGTPLENIDKYCHQCGQLNTTKRLALKDFFQEFFSNVFSYDSRLWRTIKHLLFKPGHVTKEYCAGKRISYANPFRFFLSVTIVFFLLVQLLILASSYVDKDQSDQDPLKFTVKKEDQNLFNIEIDSNVVNKQDLINKIKKSRDSLYGSRNMIENFAIDQSIKALEKDSTKIKLSKEYTTQSKLDSINYFSGFFKQMDDYSHYSKKHPEASAVSALTALEHRTDAFNIKRYNNSRKFENISDSPLEILGVIIPKIPIFLFFFAPFISLFFWLIYARGPWNYMEHMVFNFHLLTFVFLCLYLVLLETLIFNTSIVSSILFLLIGPFYLYKSLRKFYGQSRIKTIIKFVLINFAFFFLLSIASSLFLIFSIFASVDL